MAEFSTTDKEELIQAAKIAQSGPDGDEFWNQLADYFDSRRKTAETLVEPRRSTGQNEKS